jgi:hypothetical protein
MNPTEMPPPAPAGVPTELQLLNQFIAENPGLAVEAGCWLVGLYVAERQAKLAAEARNDVLECELAGNAALIACMKDKLAFYEPGDSRWW